MRKRFILLLTVFGGIPPVFSMTPPSRSVQISPGFTLHGLGLVTRDGLGVTLTTFNSTRNTRRHGSQDVSNPDDEESETTLTTLMLDNRFTHRWSAVVSIPYVESEARFTDATTGQRVKQTANGLGDISVIGRFVFWKDRPFDPARQWLGLVGLEFGTGSIKKKDDQGVLLSATQQPGSGATDYIIGTSYVWGLKRFSLYGDTTYKVHGDRAYIFGDIVTANVGGNLPFGRNRFSVVGELTGEFSGRDESKLKNVPGIDADGTVQNTGGELIYFSPALQWRPTGRWSFTAGAQWPLYQKFRGTQLKSEINYNFAVYTRFGGL